MRHTRVLLHIRRYVFKSAVMGAAVFLLAPIGAGQQNPAARQTEASSINDAMKNPELMAELGRFMGRVQHEARFPSTRSTSKLMPLLPESTRFYVAFPNYGDVAHQTLIIFREELRKNAALRDWWQHGEMAAAGPKIEDGVEEFAEVSQYLGDEIVISGAMEGSNPKYAIVAETRKPGLKTVLQKILNEAGSKGSSSVQVLDPRELGTAEVRPEQKFVVLVRPDFAVAAPDLATLRTFNAQLNGGSRTFASTPFGQRLGKAYGDGVTILGAVDLHRLISQAPTGTSEGELTFQRSGFADVKYLVWEHNEVGGHAVSRSELSFVGPRRGTASWLAPPAHLGGLDFASPKAMMVMSILLKSPAAIYDDITEIASASHANPFAGLAPFEQAYGIDLRRDLLSKLSGEITLEVDSAAPPMPVWKTMFGVNDAHGLQQTLNTLLTAVRMPPEQIDDGGQTYYTVRIPSPQKTMEIAYTFAGGYLVVGSSHAMAAEAVRHHKDGNTLAKSARFLAALPTGHPSGESALFYQDPMAMTALSLQQLAPDVQAALAQLAGAGSPTVACAYGEETAIRGESTSPALDAGVVGIAAAVAIPNLLRSKMAANETSAVGMTRTIVTAQVTYAATYPSKGFAADLASLGPDPGGSTSYTAEHAGLIDGSLANAACKTGAWCTKSGYRFSVSTECKGKPCKEFVVVSTPAGSNTGVRSFCATSDAVIRFKAAEPMVSPISATECRGWLPLQ